MHNKLSRKMPTAS